MVAHSVDIGGIVDLNWVAQTSIKFKCQLKLK